MRVVLMTQILKYDKDTELVYPIYLSLDPKQSGAVLVIQEVVGEKLYKQLHMTTETKIGKVELGRTANDGVTLKIVVSKPNLISDALENILVIATDVVSKGISNDKGFKDNPRLDLNNSLQQIKLYFDDRVTMNIPYLTRFPYTRYSEVAKVPRFIKMFNDARLVPEGYEVKYK